MSDMTRAEWDALPPILTPEQVARVAGVRPQQVLRWANRGTLPGVRIGRQWRFPKSALEFGTRPTAARDDPAGADGA